MTPGRPPSPLDPDASLAAWLGAELRTRRETRGLTQQQLGDLISYVPQHISEVERAKVTPTQGFIAACDDVLEANGRLLMLLPMVNHERALLRQERAAARRAEAAALPSQAATDSDVAGDDDVEPTDRRGLIKAAGAAALGAGAVTAPAAARDVDPELPEHWADLLRLLGRHDEIFGPVDVLASVRREIRLIAEHRAVARGDLRVALMRVEARWSDLAAWLSEDTGRPRDRDSWTRRALRLAEEADYPDMAAFARGRQSKLDTDVRSAVAHAENALRVSGARAQTQAWCSRHAAIGYALTGDATACQRLLERAYQLLADDDSPAPPWAGEFRVTHIGTRADEARCWLAMDPAKAIPLYDEALDGWPHTEARDGGIHQARLAQACVKAGERDRAEAVGRKALAVAKATNSVTAMRELKHLGKALAAR